jgi:hypothetical protein
VTTAPIIVAMRRQPEYKMKAKEESGRNKGIMMPIPQITSTKAIERTIRGLK